MMGYLFNPVREYASYRLYVCLWSYCLALAFIIVTLLSSGATDFSILLIMQVAIAVFLLSFCLLSLSRAVYISCSNQQSVSWVIFCLLMILTTLPVWFAPWVEVMATTPDKLNLIISMTPLSYLATVLDFDYLRSQWFYRHTPYGMLRYDYPKRLNAHIALSSIALLLLAIKDKQTDLINENI